MPEPKPAPISASSLAETAVERYVATELPSDALAVCMRTEGRATIESVLERALKAGQDVTAGDLAYPVNSEALRCKLSIRQANRGTKQPEPPTSNAAPRSPRWMAENLVEFYVETQLPSDALAQCMRTDAAKMFEATLGLIMKTRPPTHEEIEAVKKSEAERCKVIVRANLGAQKPENSVLPAQK